MPEFTIADAITRIELMKCILDISTTVVADSVPLFIQTHASTYTDGEKEKGEGGDRMRGIERGDEEREREKKNLKRRM